jgi:hypothetical protein
MVGAAGFWRNSTQSPHRINVPALIGLPNLGGKRNTISVPRSRSGMSLAGRPSQPPLSH